MSTIGQVFVPGGVPNVTYVPRTALNLELLVKDWLDERGKILSLSGPTKSGKTVLVRKAIPNAVEISGGDIDSVATFWSVIVDQFDAFPQIGREETTEAAHTESLNIGGEVGAVFVRAKGDFDVADTTGRVKKQSMARSRPIHLVAKEKLRQWSGTTVIFIDDFHYITPLVQLEIVRGLKQLVFDGLRVVIASVPHRAFDAVRVEKEMTGRVEQLPIPLWRFADLASIAAKGYDALNAEARTHDIERLAREAYRSPHLMQEFCLQYGKANGLRETSSERTRLHPPDDWDAFFRKRAPGASKTAFDLLAKGPPRTDRVRRVLKNGIETDIYGAILAAIAATGPVTEIEYDQLRAKLRQLLKGEPPQLHEITRVLEKMSEIARNDIDGEPVVDFDSEYRTLYISDPFFAFFLRWGTSGQKPPLPKDETNGDAGTPLAG